MCHSHPETTSCPGASMFNCEYPARGSTFLAHPVSLLVKAGSMTPTPSCHLDSIHDPSPQTDATEEGAPHCLLVPCWVTQRIHNGIAHLPKAHLGVAVHHRVADPFRSWVYHLLLFALTIRLTLPLRASDGDRKGSALQRRWIVSCRLPDPRNRCLEERRNPSDGRGEEDVK